MRVQASPLFVFGFALAATEGWSAPASPAFAASPRMPDSPAIPASPALGYSSRMIIARTPAGGDAFSGAGGQAAGGNKDGQGRGRLVGLASGTKMAAYLAHVQTTPGKAAKQLPVMQSVDRAATPTCTTKMVTWNLPLRRAAVMLIQ